MNTHFAFLLVTAVLLAGCAEQPVEKITLDTRGIKPDASVEHLADVLEHCIDSTGFVDVEKYETVTEPLTEQLKRWAVTGPTASPQLYPTASDRLAYWYNVRAGWSLYLGMLAHARRQSHADLTDDTFPVDGRVMTLGQIDKVLHALGGPSAVIGAPGMMLCRAALPQQPFAAADIHPRIKDRVMAFIDDPRRFVVDYKAQAVRFPPVIWRYRHAILDAYTQRYGEVQPTLTTALLPVVHGSAHRRLQDAIGYACVPNERNCKLAIEKW